MELTRKKAKLLCVATWWPPVYMGIFMVIWCIGAASIFGAAGVASQRAPEPPPTPVADGYEPVTAPEVAPQAAPEPIEISDEVGAGIAAVMSIGMLLLFALHAFTMVEGLALLVIYLMHVLTTKHLEGNDRVLWAVVICMTGPIGQLMYYYLKLRHMPLEEAAA